MKNYFSLLIISVCFSTVCIAQEGLEDVVYLKDGSIYRGQIVELVPNQMLRIQSNDGNVFMVNMNTVDKVIMKEPISSKPSTSPSVDSPKQERPKSVVKSTYEPRLKGYFFQSQFLHEAVQVGFRVVNGYKFGRYGYIGIGVGLDNVIASLSIELDKSRDYNGGRSTDGYRGIYIPLYLFHQGDLLKHRVTPFYTLEAGYALAVPDFKLPLSNSSSTYREGGILGGVGIGVRFNIRKRTHLSLLLNLNVKNVNYDIEYYPNERREDYVKATNNWLFFPGLRFGVGF